MDMTRICLGRWRKRRDLHASQKITPQNHGSVILEMDIADVGEVGRWLMGFGASSEVIEPAGRSRRRR